MNALAGKQKYPPNTLIRNEILIHPLVKRVLTDATEHPANFFGSHRPIIFLIFFLHDALKRSPAVAVGSAKKLSV